MNKKEIYSAFGIFLLAGFILIVLFATTSTGKADTIIVDEAGNGDHTSIQDAVNEASAGDTIRVWDGYYRESIVLDRAVDLIGNGSSKTTVEGVYQEQTSQTFAIKIYSDSCRISGFRFYGPGNVLDGIVSYYANYTNISHNKFQNFQHGMYLTGDSIDIYNNTLTNNSQNGVRIFGRKNTIANNLIMNNSYNGIFIQGGSNNTISGNHIVNNPKYGIRIDSSYFNNISGNHIQNNSDYGIYNRKSDSNVFTENIFHSFQDYSVGIYYSQNCTFIENKIQGAGFRIDGNQSVYYSNHRIGRNNSVNGKPVIYHVNKTGLNISYKTGQIILVNCSNMTIMKQNFSSGNRLLLRDCSNSTISNNIIRNCRSTGIYLTGSHNIISSNIIENCSHYEIYVDGKYNNISRNTIKNVSWYSGVLIENSEFSTVQYNNISNCSSGIKIIGSENLTICHNNFQTANIYSINIDSSVNCTLSANIMQGEGISVEGVADRYYSTHTIHSNNTVNGKPVIYYVNKTGIDLTQEKGQIILVNCWEITIENQNFSLGLNLLIRGCSNLTITENILRLHTWNNNMIEGNYIILSNNSIKSDLGYGLTINGDHNLVSHNVMENISRHGIQFQGDHNIISNNCLKNISQYGINLDGDHNNVSNNVIDFSNSNKSDNWKTGILIEGDFNNVSNNSIRDASNFNVHTVNGIKIRGNFNEVSKNNIANISGAGEWTSVRGVTIYGNSNEISKNNIVNISAAEPYYLVKGIKIQGDFNTVSANYLGNISNMGISISGDFNSVFSNQLRQNMDEGISLSSSQNCTISGNKMWNCSISLWGFESYHYDTHKIQKNNTVNGKPVRYYVNDKDITVPEQTGQVIVAECSDVLIKNLLLNQMENGIIVAFSSEITIRNNIIENNSDSGIYLVNSNFVTISDNTIKNNSKGIYCILYSNSIKISDNIVRDNSIGISITSEKSLIKDNSIVNNLIIGIYIFGNDNKINRNSIESNGIGIQIHGNNNEINENKIRNNEKGINVTNFDNNLIMGNNISENGVGILFLSDSENNIVKRNSIFKNKYYAINATDNTFSVNATNNFWGSTSGPFHPMKNHNGTGDNITNNVIFSPWLDVKVDIDSEEDDNQSESDWRIYFLLSVVVFLITALFTADKWYVELNTGNEFLVWKNDVSESGNSGIKRKTVSKADNLNDPNHNNMINGSFDKTRISLGKKKDILRQNSVHNHQISSFKPPNNDLEQNSNEKKKSFEETKNNLE